MKQAVCFFVVAALLVQVLARPDTAVTDADATASASSTNSGADTTATSTASAEATENDNGVKKIWNAVEQKWDEVHENLQEGVENVVDVLADWEDAFKGEANTEVEEKTTV